MSGQIVCDSMTESHRETALITGASRGLGSVLATFLAGNDYDLILTARGSDDLREKKKSLETSGFDSTINTVAGDVSDENHRQELGRLVAELGSLDVLINNASALGPSPLPALAEYPLSEFERVYDVNVVAPLALVQELLPFFNQRERRGLIVNITSDAAVEGYPGWGGYGASKAALELLTKTLSNELDDIGVVGVDPGDMRTEMHQMAFPGEDITDRPLPDVTIPFWSWVLGQDPLEISGGRFQAQAEQWEVP
jgi:NAD(P)-dependent dehydrogenase (short-subunit alcohol dehydrogenase family)